MTLPDPVSDLGPRLTVERIGPEAAATMLEIVRAAFGGRPPLDPPADALLETVDSLSALLSHHGGMLARIDGRAVGSLVLDPAGRTVYIRRFAVLPDVQGHGIAHAMVSAVADQETAFHDITVLAREELPRNIHFWDSLGFREIGRESPYVEMRRPLRTHVTEAASAEETQQVGRALAKQLRAGDLLVLSGGLGAGKTTFTQGLADGLGVRGPITSPTFVIARVHPSEVGGAELVHVDAYRLGSMAELDDLDLDTDLDDAVTVVEWGEGLAEGLSDSRLEVRLVPQEDTEERRIEITPVGPRWHDLEWPL